MLKESFSTKHPADKTRRWFSDDYFDLIIWINQDDSISGFQLCYDKYGKERALTWTKKNGYSHERIDDGELNPSKNLTPILVPDGLCPTQEIIDLFLSNSSELDSRLRSFVLEKLSEYHNLENKRTM
jgi:hypothetical protein